MDRFSMVLFSTRSIKNVVLCSTGLKNANTRNYRVNHCTLFCFVSIATTKEFKKYML